MVKELLSQWETEVELVDVLENPQSKTYLESQGIPFVPALEWDGEWVQGWYGEDYAQLLGVEYTGPSMLPAGELAERMLKVLKTFLKIAEAVPLELLDFEAPQGNRTLRDLLFHSFRVAGTLVESLEGGFKQPDTPLKSPGGTELANRAALVVLGEETLWRVENCLASREEVIRTGSLKTRDGQMSVHKLLERATWHCTQHLRQVDDILRIAKVTPSVEVEASLFQGLPLPESIW